MGSEIEKITLEVEGKADSSTKGINNLVKQLQQLDTTLTYSIQNLNKLSSSFSKLSQSANSLKSINFTNLTSGLKELTRTLRTVDSSSANFASMSTQLKYMSSGVNSVKRAFSSLNDLAPKLNQTNLTGLTSQLSSLKQISNVSDSFMKMKEGAKAFNSSINTISKASDKLPEVIKKINSLNLTEFKTKMNDISNVVKNFIDVVNSGNSSLQTFSKSIQKVATIKATPMNRKAKDNTTVSNKVNTLINTYGLMKIGDVFSSLIRKSNDYIETLNLFNVVMGDSTRQAWGFAQSLEAIGVDQEQAMRFQASFYDIGKSLGMTAKNAYTLSEQFTKLSYDYASLYNIPFEDSFQKLQAAIVGTTEPIRRLGKDISIAKLEEIALNLGIKESVINMTQSEKATLRFIAVMQQSTSAMNDMERTINNPANALRILRAQFVSLGREIGNLFIPALSAILPYLIAIVKFIREIVKDIASFFGIKLFEIDFNAINTSMGVADNYSSNLSDNLASGAQSAKKIKDYMIGIDELNVLNADTGSVGKDTGAAGIGSVGGDLGLDLEDFGYENILEQVESKAEEIYKVFQKWKTPIMIVAGILATMWATGKIISFINALRGVTTASNTLTGVRGIGGLASAFFGLAGGKGALAAVSTAFVTLGDKVLLATGIMTGSTVVAGLTGLGVVLGGVAIAGYAVYQAMQPSIKQFDELAGASETTRAKLEPFIETWKQLETEIVKIELQDKIITDEDAESIKSKVNELVESVLNEVSADRNEALKDIEMLEGLKAISPETYEQIKKETMLYYDDLTTQTENAQKRITEIIEMAGNENRTLTQQERDELAILRNQIAENGIKTMSESAQEQERILNRLYGNLNALTVEAGAEIIQNAKQNHERQAEEAQEAYGRQLRLLEQRFGDQATMDNEEYVKQKQALEAGLEEQLKTYEKEYDEINKKVREKLGDQAGYIEEDTGKVRNKVQKFFYDIQKWLDNNHLRYTIAEDPQFKRMHQSSGLEKLTQRSTTVISPSPRVMAFAHGGFVPPSSQFVSPDAWTAGEAGKELIGSYKGHTTVMPLENTSFVSAMYDAVYDATRNAYAENEMNIVIKPTVQLDSKKIAKGQEEYKYTSGGSLIRKK